MSFRDDIEATCDWYRRNKIARIGRGSEYEPSFTGHLMDDKLGIGTRVAFDAVQVPHFADGFSYTADSIQIPFLLWRVEQHGGLAFVLVKRGPKVFLVTDIKTLATGRSTLLDNLPEVDKAPTIMNGKAVVCVEFISCALEHCQIKLP